MGEASKVLTPQEFSRVLQLESQGNASSTASELAMAEESYKKAIAIFESRTCVTFTGIEREKLVELLSNLSATVFERQAFVQSETFASKCLYLHPGHGRASYQRAIARLNISQRKPYGDEQRIGWAIEDLRKCEPGETTAKLEQQLRNEALRIQKYQRKQNQMRLGYEAMADHRNEIAVVIANDAGYVA